MSFAILLGCHTDQVLECALPVGDDGIELGRLQTLETKSACSSVDLNLFEIDATVSVNASLGLFPVLLSLNAYHDQAQEHRERLEESVDSPDDGRLPDV